MDRIDLYEPTPNGPAKENPGGGPGGGGGESAGLTVPIFEDLFEGPPLLVADVHSSWGVAVHEDAAAKPLKPLGEKAQGAPGK